MTQEELELIEMLSDAYKANLIKEFESKQINKNHSQHQKLRLKNLCESVCEYFSIDYDKLVSNKNRKHQYTRARSIIFWFARNPNTYLGFSLERLGKLMGGFNHATVIHSINCFESDYNHINHFRIDVNNIFQSWGYEVYKVKGKIHIHESLDG